MSAALDVKRAWLVPGRSPIHHEQAKQTLRKHWPVLADAVERLAAEPEHRCPLTAKVADSPDYCPDCEMFEDSCACPKFEWREIVDPRGRPTTCYRWYFGHLPMCDHEHNEHEDSLCEDARISMSYVRSKKNS